MRALVVVALLLSSSTTADAGWWCNAGKMQRCLKVHGRDYCHVHTCKRVLRERGARGKDDPFGP